MVRMTAAARERSERGVVAILTAFLAVALLAFAALVVDLGHVRDVRRQAQNAADSAALAAGNSLYLSTTPPRVPTNIPQMAQAVSAARAYAAANFGTTADQWATCSDPARPPGYHVPSGSTACISFDQQATPHEVRVRLPTTTVSTPLGGLLGRSTVDVAAHAHAKLNTDARAECALCILGTGVHDLQNGGVSVAGGDINSNGSVSVGPQGLVSIDGAIKVQNQALGSLGNYSPQPTTGQPAITDPLASVTLPPDMSALSVRSNPCTDGPGRYGAYSFPNSTCALSPGVYVIAGAGNVWALSGSTSQVLTGNGVTLYFTCGTPAAPAACASGQAGATMDGSGNGQITIQAPTSGPLEGLVFVMDRANTSTFRLTGNAASGMAGTIYMASGKLQMSGNGCATTNALVVVGDLEMNGSGSCLHSSYVPSDNVRLPPARLRLNW